MPIYVDELPSQGWGKRNSGAHMLGSTPEEECLKGIDPSVWQSEAIDIYIKEFKEVEADDVQVNLENNVAWTNLSGEPMFLTKDGSWKVIPIEDVREVVPKEIQKQANGQQ